VPGRGQTACKDAVCAFSVPAIAGLHSAASAHRRLCVLRVEIFSRAWRRGHPSWQEGKLTNSTDRSHTVTGGPPESLARRPGPLRRLYEWTIHWAETPWAGWALFWLAFAEAFFFPVPADVLLIAMALGAPRKSLRYAAICTAGSLLGGCMGYVIGMFFFDSIGSRIFELFNAWDRYEQLRAILQRWGFWGVLFAAVTPFPYMIFTVGSGVFGVRFVVFLLASLLGRSVRFFTVGTLFRLFGAPVKRFIDRYFNLLTIALMILLLLGFICVRMLSSK